MKNPRRPKGDHLTRRSFLSKFALAGSAVALPSIIPASCLGRGGRLAPSERILLGGIGIGGRGTYDLSILLQQPDVQFVAVADVRKERREAAKKLADDRYGNADCATYRDFRDLLAERQDLDAVLIATGDRWHTPAAVRAMQAGKDVFCEKPCTMSIAQGQALVQAARRWGRIFQAGIQRLSEANFVFADELVRTGRLGKVHTVRAHILPWLMKTDWLPAEPEPDRETLDWDLWLGPASRRPFNKAYLPGCMAWLNYSDFGTGIAGWGSHTICQCQSALDLLHSSATEYEYPRNDTAEGMVCRFQNGVKLVLSPTGWTGTCGVRYEGTEGWVSIADNYRQPEVSDPSFLADFQNLSSHYQSRTGRQFSHIRDFLDAVRSRRPCIANEVVAHRSMSTNHAINACMLLKRNLRWDPKREEFVGDAEANRMRTCSLRSPWEV